MTRILVVDNYDSFVYTIVGYLQQLGAETVVVRNDAVPDPSEWGDVDGVLVSPGPGTPRAAGQSMDVIQQCADRALPMLGVCLGHQALAEVFGATVSHAPELMHGKTSRIAHHGEGVLAGLDDGFTATRYHSLAVVDGTVPDDLVVTARTVPAGEASDGIIMGLQHRDLPLFGVQFHPESVLTEGGHRLLANWLEECGLEGAVERSAGMHPLVRETARA
ncbi:aminodeoxychorismate/anthranilate synthase component II [Actinotalea sp. M2MS4P-6]|uniref:aminodeoxychorismate/anthranilate synthase component II n=1 Tax=Actinotalea sp. M2MS4P-6 TaxID=2983762 RepID=UPI0021E509B4|nr:aminodeoxychorismate/anthranilate synthase component II [Actinotalea sp. M2MS4P-6]MCV2392825.1 aminodeoxychorismate/anthranilate synthase component II [Actinotalea sp. M2MS4P-6]